MNFLRQQDLLNPGDVPFPITIIGCGGIGSWVTLALAKMGCPDISVVDFDVVEAHNLPTQFFTPQDLYGHKSRKLADNVERFTGIRPKHFAAMVPQEEVPLKGLVISGVDSMAMRQEIWEKIRQEPETEWYIDGRMGATILELYTVKMDSKSDIQYYESTLGSDFEAYPLPCTAQAIAFTVFGLAAEVGSQVFKIAKDRRVERCIWRDYSSNLFLKEVR